MFEQSSNVSPPPPPSSPEGFAGLFFGLGLPDVGRRTPVGILSAAGTEDPATGNGQPLPPAPCGATARGMGARAGGGDARGGGLAGACIVGHRGGPSSEWREGGMAPIAQLLDKRGSSNGMAETPCGGGRCAEGGMHLVAKHGAVRMGALASHSQSRWAERGTRP